MTWSQYVARVCGDDQGRDFEAKTGIDGSTLSRWKHGESSGLRVDKVASFARGYGVPVLEAFVEAGFISPEEAGAAPPARPDLSSITNDELVDMVRERLGVADPGADGTVTNLSDRHRTVPEKRVAYRPKGGRKPRDDEGDEG